MGRTLSGRPTIAGAYERDEDLGFRVAERGCAAPFSAGLLVTGTALPLQTPAVHRSSIPRGIRARSFTWIVGGLTVVAGLLVWYRIGSDSFWYDEDASLRYRVQRVGRAFSPSTTAVWLSITRC